MKPFLGLALLATALTPAVAAPLRLTNNLASFSVYEKTGPTDEYIFAVNSAQITTKLNTIYSQFPDIQSQAGERFDVYYSNASGNFDIDGEYLTVDCIYDGSGSGCNIAEVRMNRTGESPLGASSLLRFVSAFGYLSGSELLALDGNLNTAASLGTGEGTIMSLTFGFSPTSGSEVPEPSTYALMFAGLATMVSLRRKR